jgi:hypothetical protein
VRCYKRCSCLPLPSPWSTSRRIVSNSTADALILIACHRVVLLGDDSLENPWGLHWSARELRFCLWLAAQDIVLAVGLVILARIETLALGFLLLLPLSYAFSRASLWLPATAIDGDPTFESASALSRGNGWRLVIALFIVPGFVAAASVGWRFAVALAIVPDLSSVLAREQAAFVAIARSVWMWLFLVFDVAALSVAFRMLSAAEATAGQGAAAGAAGATSASVSSSVST